MIIAGFAVLAAGCSSGRAASQASDRPPSTTEQVVAPRVQDSGGGVLRIGVVGVDTLDPARANPASASAMLVTDLLFDGLTGYDATRRTVVGVVANGWSLSADGLTWTFTIDPAATFADGTPIRSIDVKAAIERVAARGDGSVPGVRLDAIVGHDQFVAKTASDIVGIIAGVGAVQFRLRSPYSALAELLAHPAFGVVKASDANGETFAASPVTSGSFGIVSRTETTISLSRTPRSQAVLGGVEVHLFREPVAAFDAFLRGTVDQAPVPEVRVADAPALARGLGGSVISEPQGVSYMYGMNLAAPALAKAPVRQAILRAIDRNAIRTKFFPDSATMTGIIGPGAAGRRADACGTACSYDPAAAIALVKTAYPSGEVPKVHVDYATDAEGREAKIADAIAANLNAVGIPAAVRAHPAASFGAFVASGDAEIFRYGWIGSYPSADSYLSPFERRGADNVFSIDDDALAASLDQGRRASTEDARQTAYLSAEDRLFSLAPVVPLVQYQSTIAFNAKVRDLAVAPDGSIDLLRVKAVE